MDSPADNERMKKKTATLAQISVFCHGLFHSIRSGWSMWTNRKTHRTEFLLKFYIHQNDPIFFCNRLLCIITISLHFAYAIVFEQSSVFFLCFLFACMCVCVPGLSFCIEESFFTLVSFQMTKRNDKLLIDRQWEWTKFMCPHSLGFGAGKCKVLIRICLRNVHGSHHLAF